MIIEEYLGFNTFERSSVLPCEEFNQAYDQYTILNVLRETMFK